MTNLNILDRGIAELRKLLSQYWQDLASRQLTSYERCELRVKMVEANADLRRCLQAHEMEARRLRDLSANTKPDPQSELPRVLLNFVKRALL